MDVKQQKFRNFRNLIGSILYTYGKLKKEYIEKILDERGMFFLRSAFTSEGFDPKNNYEFMESLGDISIKKAIVWYFSRRFPQLNCSDGVKVIAKLRAKYESVDGLRKMAETLNLWEHIVATESEMKHSESELLEDVMEAFIGSVEYLIDLNIKVGVGYSIVYNIISSLLNREDISIEFEELTDPITRLKELSEAKGNPEILGNVSYSTKSNKIEGKQMFITFVNSEKYGELSRSEQNSSKVKSRNEAAQKALDYIKDQNIPVNVKVDEIYTRGYCEL